jgi:hypothetical protein
LFTELDARNRDLTEALEQQTATSEILRVISQSPTNVQPVFDTIAAATLKLCAAGTAIVATFDGELIHVGATANVDPKGAEAIQSSLKLGENCFHYLKSHGALDIEHMKFFESLMNKVEDKEDQGAIIHMARRIYILFANMFRAIPHDRGLRHAA